MVKNLLVVVLTTIVLGVALRAQKSTEIAITNSLEGVLRDMFLDECIPFAKVALFQNKQLVQGVDTDGFGKYTFTDILSGTYQIKASLYGYNFENIAEVQIDSEMQHIVDLDFSVNDEIFSSVAVVGAKVKRHAHVTVCGIGSVSTKNTKEIETTSNSIETKKSNEIGTKSNQSIFEKNPFSTPKDLLLYPNPSSGLITIELDFEQLDIQLINTIGQILGSIPFNEVDKDIVQLDLSSQAAGTYFLNITHDLGSQIEKVVIVHL